MALLECSFVSQKLFRAVSMTVILPVDKPDLYKNGSTKKQFKTLYLLHGLLGNHKDWISGTRIQRWAEEKNLAVIMPSGENSYYVDKEKTGLSYGEFIGEELVEITRRMFPLSDKREDTFIGGLSMGGYGAVRNGLKYNHIFHSIIGLSTAFYFFKDTDKPLNRDIDFVENWFGDFKAAVESDKNPKQLVEMLKEEHLPRIFMACGMEDDLIEANRIYRDFFLENGLDITYYESAGGHTWDFWDNYIKKALDWLPLDI